MAITLYSLPSCPYSRALRERLVKRGAQFTEIDVAARPECVPELVKLTRRRRIVPVLVDGARIQIAPDGGTEF